MQINVQIGEDEFLLDKIPDNPGHFVAVEFDDWVCNFDLVHIFLCQMRIVVSV